VLPGSLAEKVNSALVSTVSGGGPDSIEVSGGAVSTVQATAIGVGSTIALKVARAANVCTPCASALYVTRAGQAV
jgi:hypothetical protein